MTRNHELSVSVVIPVYNGVAFVAETLASVFSQTLLPRDVIVVDDASTDGTAALIESMVDTAPVPLRVLRLGQNSGGPARPINRGIEIASGDLIAVCDQDDVLSPMKLEEQTVVLARHPDVSFVFSLCEYDRRQGESPQTVSVKEKLGVQGQALDGYRVMDGAVALRLLMEYSNIAVGYPGFIFRRESWRRKGGVDEGYRIGSDYDFLCWLCMEGAVAYIPKAHYVRRIHDQNLSVGSISKLADIYRIRERFLRKYAWLLGDRALSSRLRDDFLGFAYWLREAGDYLGAVEIHLLSMRIWGYHLKPIWELTKLLPHWFLRRMSRLGSPALRLGGG
jgi:glycosyltransferase involved in cell wall biosynthesis